MGGERGREADRYEGDTLALAEARPLASRCLASFSSRASRCSRRRVFLGTTDGEG